MLSTLLRKKLFFLLKIVISFSWFFVVLYFYTKSTNLSGFYYLHSLAKSFVAKAFSNLRLFLLISTGFLLLFYWLKKKIILLFALVFLAFLHHFLLEIGLVIWLNLVAIGLGIKIIKRPLVFTWGLGMILISYLVFLLGIMRLLYVQIFYLILIIIFFLCLKEIYQTILSAWEKTKNYWKKFSLTKYSIKNIFLILLISFYLTLAFLQTLAPETKCDALHGHLYLPKLYLAKHQIYHEKNVLLSSTVPQTAEMIFLAGLMLKNEIVTKLLVCSFGLFLISLISNFCQKFFIKKNVGLTAIAIFITIPLIGWSITTAYTDIPQTFYFNLALFSLFNWKKTKKKHFPWLFPFFLGCASSIKYTTVYFLLPAFLLLLFFFLKQKVKLGKLFRSLTIFSFLFILPLIPWFIKNYLSVGNPVFPFLNHFFNPQKTVMNNWLDAFIYYVRFGQLGLPRTIKNLILLPWNITVVDKFEENIGPLLLCFTPLLIFVKKIRIEIKIFLIFIIISLYSWVWGTQTTRYLTPILPMASIIAAYALIKMRSLILFIPLVLISIPPFTHRLSYKIFPPPIEYVFKGPKYKNQYLKEHLYTYQMYQYINKNLKNERVKILSFFDPYFYYVNVPIVYSFHYGGEFFYLYEKNNEELFNQLLKKGFTHIMFNRNVNYHAKLFLTDDFVKNYLELIHQENNVYLFKIYGRKLKQQEDVYFDFVDQNLSEPNLCPVADEIKRSIITKGNNKQSFKTKIKPNSSLKFFTGVCHQGFGVSDGVLTEILINDKKVFSLFLKPNSGWHEEKIDLSDFSNQDVVINFVSQCKECNGDWAGFGEPLLIQKKS